MKTKEKKRKDERSDYWMDSVITNEINETEEGNKAITNSQITMMTEEPEDEATKSCMIDHISIRMQPFINKVEYLRLAVGQQIKAFADSEKIMAGTKKNSSVFAADDDFLNPAIIGGTNVASHNGNKSYLSMKTP